MPQPHKGDREQLSTRVPQDLADRARRRADATGRSLSDLLAAALGRYLDEAGQKCRSRASVPASGALTAP